MHVAVINFSLFLRILCKLGRILQNLRLTLFDSTPLLLSTWTLPNNRSTGLYMTLPSSTCIQYSMSVEHLQQSTCTQSCNVKIFGYRYIHLIAEASLTTRVHAFMLHFYLYPGCIGLSMRLLYLQGFSNIQGSNISPPI